MRSLNSALVLPTNKYFRERLGLGWLDTHLLGITPAMLPSTLDGQSTKGISPVDDHDDLRIGLRSIIRVVLLTSILILGSSKILVKHSFLGQFVEQLLEVITLIGVVPDTFVVLVVFLFVPKPHRCRNGLGRFENELVLDIHEDGV